MSEPEEVRESGDEDNNATGQDRKRTLEGFPLSKDEVDREDGEKPKQSSLDDSSDAAEASPAKKKSRVDEGQSEKKEKKKREKNRFVDDEAEESGDDEGSEGGSEEEDQDQYEDDGMIVLDGEEDEDSDDEAARRERRKEGGVERKRLKRSKHLSVVEDEDLELLQDNLLQAAQSKRSGSQHSAPGISAKVEGDGEIQPERVHGFEDEDEDDLQRAGTTGTARLNRYVDDYDSDEMKGFIEDDDEEEGGDEEEDEEAREERRRKRKELER